MIHKISSSTRPTRSILVSAPSRRTFAKAASEDFVNWPLQLGRGTSQLGRGTSRQRARNALRSTSRPRSGRLGRLSREPSTSLCCSQS